MFRVQGAGCRWGVSNGGMKGGRMKGPSNRHLLKPTGRLSGFERGLV